MAWAEDADAWIVEDDYDSEYRFWTPPLEPLKQLDRGSRVLLMASFSRTLFPGLRLGYVAAPAGPLGELALLAAHRRGLGIYSCAAFSREVDTARGLALGYARLGVTELEGAVGVVVDVDRRPGVRY